MDEMITRTRIKTGLTMVGFLMLALLLAHVSWADQRHGETELCWQLSPFDDTIKVNIQELQTPGKSPVRMFGLAIHWQGLDVYELDGGGTETDNLQADTFTLDIVLHNPSPFFGGHPICRLTIATGPELTGPWVADCLGRTPPSQGGTPYLAQGTLTPIACADEASPQSMAPLYQGGRLAGIP